MFTVIAYDIVDDRKRYRVAQDLREYSLRVQKSVFEAPHLVAQDLQRLRRRIESRIDLRVDKVRYYSLCAACRARVQVAGPGAVTEHEEYKII